MLPQIQALGLLRPDLVPRVQSGEIELDDVRDELWTAFWAGLKAAGEGAA